MPLFHNDESMYSDTRDQRLAEKDKTIQAMGKSCADYQNKIRLLENELADISNKVSYLMVKIVRENVPLFPSDRLRHIHAECREILDLVKNRVTVISFEKPPIAEMTVAQELEKLRAENTNLKINISKFETIAESIMCNATHELLSVVLKDAGKTIVNTAPSSIKKYMGEFGKSIDIEFDHEYHLEVSCKLIKKM